MFIITTIKIILFRVIMEFESLKKLPVWAIALTTFTTCKAYNALVSLSCFFFRVMIIENEWVMIFNFARQYNKEELSLSVIDSIKSFIREEQEELNRLMCS